MIWLLSLNVKDLFEILTPQQKYSISYCKTFIGYEVIALKRYIKIRDGFVVVGVGYLIKVNRNSEEVDNEINTKNKISTVFASVIYFHFVYVFY